MEPTVPTTNQKREPGVFQGTPAVPGHQTPASPSAPRPIRTMKSDSEEAVRRQNETAVSIAIAEGKKREKERAIAETKQAGTPVVAPKRIGRVFVLVGLILVIVALVLAYIFVLPKLEGINLPNISLPTFSKPTSTTTTPTEKAPVSITIAKSLIPAQLEKRFNITKETPTQIHRAISLEREQAISNTTIKNLYFTEDTGSATSPISASKFISFSGVQVPEMLTRSLEQVFMAGLYAEGSDNTPFLILKISGYDTAFAGMLEWESGLQTFFKTIFYESTGTISLGSSKFRDIVISGRDARILDVSPGNTIVYSFVNPSTIIITGSTVSLEAIMKLATKI